MNFKIRFCPCNAYSKDSPIKDHLRDLPDTELTDGTCLNYCGQCLISPFAIINGKNIVSETDLEVMGKILEFMEKFKEKQQCS